MRDAMIVREPAEHAQDVLPIVSIRFLACDAAQQHQIQSPCIVNVWSYIHEIFGSPPKSHGGAERIASLEKKRCETDDRHEDLTQSPAEKHHEPSKRHKEEVACFVERQID